MFRVRARLTLILLLSCGTSPSSPDERPGDGGQASDAGPGSDAGAGGDAGEGLDAGSSSDAGVPLDAGSISDAGSVSDAGAGDAGAPVDGVVFVHGLNGSAADWLVMVGRFRDAGWPQERLIANSYSDPRWGCNGDNAMQLSTWVQQLEARGARRIAIVAHSMGGLSSRHFLKTLMGTRRVAVFTSLGTMHNGIQSACLNPLPVCVWQEVCGSGAFLRGLNAPPSTPGPTAWFSIFSDGDTTVPMASSQLTGATNILVPGLQHSGPQGLQDSPVVFDRVLETFR